MALDTLEVFGTEYTNVAGFKATDDGGNTKTYIRPQGTISISANGTGIDVSTYASADVAVTPPSPSLQTKTKSYTPSETAQSETVAADTGYDGLDEVSISVGAISSSYVGSAIDRRDSSNLSASGATVTAPSGYYASNATKTVSSGTEGTPTATKGTVSNHSISVTPSVTNSAGYISGSTKTGTAVTVSASELVSGSETKTANGTYDVTNLASLVVNVSGGGGTDRLVLLQTTSLGSLSTSSTSATDTGKTVSLASSTNWQNYDLLLVDISVDTTTNGRHTSTVTPVILTGTSNVSTKNTYTVGSNKWNSKLGSTGTASSRQSTTAYGVYINAASVSSNTLTLTVYYKYNSNNTGTLNGTYTARVYGVKLIDLIGG